LTRCFISFKLNIMKLSNEELKRYSRHLILPEIGQDGQCKLKNAKILIVGAGGLGSPSAIYLAACGVGTIGIIDPDRVELTNLHRQVIHFTRDVNKAKVISAKDKIRYLNPNVRVIPYKTKFSAQNALEIMRDYDLVIDGSDNFPTRYLINDACIFTGKPFVYGGVHRFEGQCSVFGMPDGPCYRCFFQEPPPTGEVPSCAEAGVVGTIPGIVGLLQANEAIKLICQIGEPLKGRLLIFDALTTQFRNIIIKKDPECAICSSKRTIHELTEYEPICQTQQSSSRMIFGRKPEVEEISVQGLKKVMDKHPSGMCLIDVREQKEWDIAKLPGALLKPFSTFEKNYADIPKDKTVYFHCKAGGRSTKAIQFLKSKGFSNQLVNIKGGIDAWAKEIDPKMPRY